MRYPYKAFQTLYICEEILALTFEALEGRSDAFHPYIHQSRNHYGQIKTAQHVLDSLEGSPLLKQDYKKSHHKIQDPYSIRCVPQVYGASRDLLLNAKKTIENEMGAATDNPLIFPEEELILSGGNFHGEYLAFGFDTATMAVAEIGSLSERRLDLMFNPQFSQTAAFLSPNPGLCSGYMAAQYLSASLVNENKMLCYPCSTDSIPGNVGVEDHVSMGMTSVRKLKKTIDNVLTSICCEWVTACQACDLKKISPQGKRSLFWYELLRNHVPFLDKDRIISYDIQKARELLEIELKERCHEKSIFE